MGFLFLFLITFLFNISYFMEEYYIDVLNKFWGALGTYCCVNWDVQWFQQDRATPHTANIMMEGLDHQLPKQLISRHCEPKLSPYSHNLNLPDFCLWGFLKNVFENSPHSIGELKVPINQKILAILKKECISVIDNFA